METIRGNVEEGLNTIIYEQDGAIVMKSTCVIKAGDEIKCDYHDFNIPEFYIQFCKENDMVDVRSMVMEAIGE